MTPADFPESNIAMRAPADLDESQCGTIRAWRGEINGGSVDGVLAHVVAWKPSPLEVSRILAGFPIFLSVVGGLPPHFLTTSFEEATHPS